MRTSELSGAALQHAVMLAEGWTYVPNDGIQCSAYCRIVDSTARWTIKGPNYLAGPAGDDIIDREKIDTRHIKRRAHCWEARIDRRSVEQPPITARAATRREAAMRAWVAHNLGDEIKLPEDLRCDANNAG